MVQPSMTSFFFVCPLPLDALDALDQQGHRDQDYGDITQDKLHALRCDDHIEVFGSYQSESTTKIECIVCGKCTARDLTCGELEYSGPIFVSLKTSIVNMNGLVLV